MSVFNRIQWYADYDFSADVVRLYCRTQNGENQFVFGRTVNESGGIQFQAYEEKEMRRPLLVLNMGDARALLDALWEAGLRPKSGEGSSGQLGATENHLKDMQAIVWRLLGRLAKEVES